MQIPRRDAARDDNKDDRQDCLSHVKLKANARFLDSGPRDPNCGIANPAADRRSK